MEDPTVQKYVVIIVLFGIFLVLANVWNWKRHKGRVPTARRRRRRSRRRAGGPAPDPEPVEPIEEEGLFTRYLPWISGAALLVCIAALGLIWYIAALGTVNR